MFVCQVRIANINVVHHVIARTKLAEMTMMFEVEDLTVASPATVSSSVLILLLRPHVNSYKNVYSCLILGL